MNNAEINEILNQLTLEQKVKVAIFSAELALPFFEYVYPNDKHPRNAINAVKKLIGDPSKIKAAAADAADADAANAAADAIKSSIEAGGDEVAQKIMDYARDLID